MPNQTRDGLPQAALINGDHGHNDILSFLPGQRLSRCTCEGESHPGPKHEDGTYVGRSAPEIDVFEAQVGWLSISSTAVLNPAGFLDEWESSKWRGVSVCSMGRECIALDAIIDTHRHTSVCSHLMPDMSGRTNQT